MTVLPKSKLNSSDPQTSADGAENESGNALYVAGAQAPGAIDPAVGTTGASVTFAGSGLVFNNTFGSGVSPAFQTAILAAEDFFESQFTNTVTLNISFDLTPLSNQFSGSNNFSPIQHVPYATLAAALSAYATTADDLAAVNSLPAVDPTAGAGFAVPVGMARILGLAGSGSGLDDRIVLNSNLDWTFGADAVGVLEHEISEGAMGRIAGLGDQNNWWGPMDLFRYAAPNQHDYSGGLDGLASYFSANGTDLLLPFNNSLNTAGTSDGQDFGDWASNVRGDAFGASGPNAPGTVSATDLRVMDILGWTPAPSSPAQAPNFTVTDTTTNTTTTATGDAYVGPVAGLEYQYAKITPDSLNITSSVPNAFIHSGSGTDAIDVSKANGNNVIDGSTGSNFLVGGTGDDTFFLDDRNATSPIYSTIVNFHSGDTTTVWGVSAADFTLKTLDNQGAVGAQGLAFIFNAAGHFDTRFVLAGYTSADLANGRITLNYGVTADQPATPYLTLHAT